MNSFQQVGAALVSNTAQTAGLIATFATLAAAATAVVLAFAPLAAALAGVAALGAYFDVIKKGAPLHKAFFGTLQDIFKVVGKIAGVVSKPLFTYLLGQLRDLDKWVKTAQFRRGMEELGRMLPKIAKAFIGAGKSIFDWWIRNWPTWQKIIGTTITILGKLADAVKFVAREFNRYWPAMRHAAEVAYNWFMQNLYPGLRRAFLGIAQIVVALAHGFQRAWPQISAALVSAWQLIHPVLDGFASGLGKIQDALNWLAQHSGGAIGALASAINHTLGGVQAVISGISSALSTLVSALQTAQSLAGLGGSPGSGGQGGAPSTGKGHVGRSGHGRTATANVVNIHLDRKVIASVLVDANKTYSRQNGGRSLFAI